MNGAPVPHDWTAMISHLNAAQVAEAASNNPQQPPALQEEARARYSREVGLMFACLSRLRETQELGRITLLLAKRERR